MHNTIFNVFPFPNCLRKLWLKLCLIICFVIVICNLIKIIILSSLSIQISNVWKRFERGSPWNPNSFKDVAMRAVFMCWYSLVYTSLTLPLSSAVVFNGHCHESCFVSWCSLISPSVAKSVNYMRAISICWSNTWFSLVCPSRNKDLIFLMCLSAKAKNKRSLLHHWHLCYSKVLPFVNTFNSKFTLNDIAKKFCYWDWNFKACCCS